MPNKEVYEYAVVRFVPKVEREEFMNVGVIVLCQRKKFLQMRYLIDENRIKAFAKDVEIDDLKRYLNAWNAVCEGAKNGGKIGGLDIQVRFRWLTASRSTIIQSSRVHPGLSADPEVVLKDIFETYVLVE